MAAEPVYRKSLKYRVLPSSYSFLSSVVETLGVTGNEVHHLLTDASWCIEKEFDDKSALQCVSIAIQRGNAVSVLGTLN